MLKPTLKCFNCKEEFRREELISYASLNSNVFHNYCPKCLKEKQERENFANKVCQIFGLKAPGPRIWTERKRLQDKYGYTDDVLVRCLEYIYNIEKKRKLADSLYLINPITVERMLAYEKTQENKAIQLVNAMKTVQKEYVVPIKENIETHRSQWNPDDWLED